MKVCMFFEMEGCRPDKNWDPFYKIMGFQTGINQKISTVKVVLNIHTTKSFLKKSSQFLTKSEFGHFGQLCITAFQKKNQNFL